MAYQKLQAYRALAVIPSDTIDIPGVSGPLLSSATDGVAATNKLVDSTVNFGTNGVSSGDIVYNTTTATGVATVTDVDDANTLSLSADIMASGEDYTIFVNSPNPGCVLYSGAGGDIKVRTAGGDDVTLAGTAAGAFLPLQVVRVFATPAPPAGIIAMW